MQTCFFSSYAECPVNLPLLVYNRENEKNTKKSCKIYSLRSFLESKLPLAYEFFSLKGQTDALATYRSTTELVLPVSTEVTS